MRTLSREDGLRLGVSVPDVEDCTGEIPSEIPDVVLETGDLITTEKEILAAGRSPSTQAGRPRGISTQQPWNGGHGIVALVGRIGRRRSANKKVLFGEKNQDTDTSPSSNLPSEEGGARSQRRAGIEVFAGPLWSHASWLSTNDHGDRRDQRKSHRQNESWPWLGVRFILVLTINVTRLSPTTIVSVKYHNSIIVFVGQILFCAKYILFSMHQISEFEVPWLWLFTSMTPTRTSPKLWIWGKLDKLGEHNFDH